MSQHEVRPMVRNAEIEFGDDSCIQDGGEFYRVLGYLCSWGNQSSAYTFLRIFVCSSDEIKAVYSAEHHGPCTFLLVAIRDKTTGKWSTHS